MSDFQKQALSALKANMAGLPSFCRLVMYEIFEYIDFSSSTISIISLEKLALDYLQVDPLRGRQKEIINGDTIRNAFRTIKKAKPDHFKFTTVNQRIVIEMPFLRELYQSIHGEASDVAAVLAADVVEAKTLAQTSESGDLDHILTGDVAADLAAASLNDTINAPIHTHAKIKPNFKPNNNTNFVSSESVDLKTPIADDFYPSAFVIDKAQHMGLSKVTDTTELNKFILFNQASGSRWANWDYVYLTWLQRDAEREQARAAACASLDNKEQNHTSTGRLNHVVSRHTSKRSVKQRVIDAWREDGLDYCEQTNRFNARGTAPQPATVQYIDINTLGPID